ncbi:MAG: aminotransferase class I/II-fold pyridoxal phosphate-dependent enzyme [Planctomycetes bacterium]|nr:aminotransferase class I/II-fold pyridoxal phosphate-dependent enzyme [Planctomycetota bacterium]
MKNLDAFVAKRIADISTSGIRRIFDLAATMENPIDFSMGQPDFAVPDAIKAAAHTAIDADQNGYTVTHGLAELRAKIKSSLAREFDWDPAILATCGVSGGLNLAMTAICNPGDEILIPDPYFVSYPMHVSLSGGVPIPIDTAPGFEMTADLIERALTPKSKAILLNSPSNPTGVIYSEKNVKEICDLARRNDLLIISDEIYNLLSFDAPPTSPVTYAPERTILLRGFGKSYGMTGWRMGFAAGADEIISQMAKVQQYTFVCAPHPFQRACITALDQDMSDVIAAYRIKRDLCAKIMGERFKFAQPGGGFFLYCQAPDSYANGTAFVEAAVGKNVLTVPGGAFSQHDTHFRISYAVANEKLTEGCQILHDLAG